MQGQDGTSTIRPLRVKPSVAAKMLGVGYQTVLDLIHNGTFTAQDNGKRGTKRRLHLLVSEIELYCERGSEALKEHRAKKNRKR